MSNTVSQLALQAQTDHTSMWPLWLAVERLITLWANKYRPGNGTRLYDADDLTQAGYIALVDAVRDYDPERGEFTTLLGYHVRRRFAEVIGTRGAKPRPELGAVSLDLQISQGGNMTQLDQLTDPVSEYGYDDVDERITRQGQAAALLAEVDKLPDPLCRALRLTAWEGRSLSEVAGIMGIEVKEVKQNRRNAADRVRRTKTGREIGRDYYATRHVGLSRYLSTGISEVEDWLLWRERLEQMRKERCRNGQAYSETTTVCGRIPD